MNKISRRHFLAATGAITGAALLNPLSEVAAKAVENPNVAGKNFALLLWYWRKRYFHVGI